MKRAGIIVGVTLILAAVFVFWLTDSMKHKKDAGGAKTPPVSLNKPSVSPSTDKQPRPVPQTVTPAPVKSQPAPVPSQVIPSPTATQSKQQFLELDESDLGQPFANRKEIMVVAKKKITVMDSDVGNPGGKQLVYTADLMGNNNSTRMALYLNGVAYAGIAVGDRLQVSYSIFKNDRGIEFPVIISAEKSQ